MFGSEARSPADAAPSPSACAWNEGTGDNGKVWTPDPSKAREYAVNMIFDKLVLSTVEDYLRSPDKYREDINMRAELKTRELLKELVAYYKKQ